MEPFRWQATPDGEGKSCITIGGALTEASDFVPVLERAASVVVLDLGEVYRINSGGIREWIRFITQLCDGREVTLRRCAVPMVEQFNLISNMRGVAKVESVLLPYYCSACDEESRELLELDGGVSISDTLPCPHCQAPMEFDALADRYLSFLEYQAPATRETQGGPGGSPA